MEIIYLYVVINYLFAFGLLFGYSKSSEKELTISIGAVIHFVFAPIINPIILGVYFYEKSD